MKIYFCLPKEATASTKLFSSPLWKRAISYSPLLQEKERSGDVSLLREGQVPKSPSSRHNYHKSSIKPPPGGLFFSSTFEGGLNREGGLF